MTTLLHLLISAVCVVGCAHAQYNFCNDTFQRTANEDVRSESHVTYFQNNPLDRLRVPNRHDLVEGECTGFPVFGLFDRRCAGAPSSGYVGIGEVYDLSENRIISCVKALDRDETGNGGFPVVLKGGVGFNMLQLQLYSQEKHGLAFYIEIYYNDP